MKKLLQINRFMVMMVAMLTLSVTQMLAVEYQLVTSTSDLVAGCKYIIGSAKTGSAVFMSTATNNNNRKVTSAATITNNKVEATNDMLILQLGGTAGAWTLQTTNYTGTNGYLASAGSGSNNYCRVITNSTTGTISFSNDAAVITLQPHATRNVLKYNNSGSSSLFACYSSGQNAIYLFKEIAVKSVVSKDANIQHGDVSAEVGESAITFGTTEVESGKTVSLSNNPEDNYVLDAYEVYKTEDPTTTVAVTNGKFTMPEYAVTVSATFVEAKTLTGITLNTDNVQKVFWVGQTFNSTGLVVTAQYDGANPADVTDKAVVTAPSFEVVGDGKTVNVSYTEGVTKEKSYNVDYKSIANTEETAYTTAEAIALIDINMPELTTVEVYVKGTISKIDSYSSQYHSITYWLDDNTFEVYSGLAKTGEQFTKKEDLTVGDQVVVKGKIKAFGTPVVYEFDKNNVLISRKLFSELSWSAASFDAEIGQENAFPTLTTQPANLTGVKYYSSNTAAATIDETTGAITLGAEGQTTITAKYAAVADTLAAEDASYTLNVKAEVVRYTIHYNTDGGAEIADVTEQTVLPQSFPATTKAGFNFDGWYTSAEKTTKVTAGGALTQDTTLYAKWADPYDVATALLMIAYEEYDPNLMVYTQGVVSKAPTSISSGKLTYNISDNGVAADELKVYNGKNLNNTNFSAKTDLAVGDTVVVYGKLYDYNGTYEINDGNYLYSYKAVQPKAIVIDDQLKNGTIEADKATAKVGETVTLTITPAMHYHLKANSLVVLDENLAEIDVTDNKFTMPLTAVTVSAEFEQDTKYTISLDKNDAAMGSVKFDGTTDNILEFFEGETPTIVATKNAGYRFVNWTTTDDVTIADVNSATTTITVKQADATITANFEVEPATKVVITLNENGTETSMPGDYYAGEAFNLPTTAGGGCSKAISFVGWSTKEITEALPTQPEENFFAPGASFTPSQDTTLYAVYAKVTPGGYTKVTAAPADWSGEYMLVYDDADSVAWTGVDAGQCRVDVTIASNKIATKPASAVTLTVASMEGGYSLRVNGGANNGKYINKTTYANGMDILDEPSANTLSYNNGVIISGSGKSGESYVTMRYNSNSGASNERFRYYKSGQQAIALYKKSADAGTDYKTSCTAAIEVAAPTFSPAAGTYTTTQSVELACTTENSTIYYTTNGDEPTSASTKYTSAIEVAANTTIKAIAYVGTDNYSEVASASYVILKADNSYWYTLDDQYEEVLLTDTTIYTDGELDLYLQYESEGEITFDSSDKNVATVAKKEGYSDWAVLTIKATGTTTISATIASDGTYAGSVATFVLHVIEHKTVVTMSFPQASYDATLGQAFSAPELTVNPTVSGIVYSSSKENVATVDATTGAITLVAMGSTTIKATYAGDETHDPANASYTLNVIDPNADVITAADLAATTTQYKDFSITKESGTQYKGNSAKDNSGNIQLRSSNSSGIVSTSTIGYISAISATDVSTTSRTLQVYGKNTAYTAASDLYNNATKGTLLGTIVNGAAFAPESGVTLSDYKYIGVRSYSGAMQLSDISIAWTPATFYDVAVTTPEHGTIAADMDKAAAGETVTLTATPADGYELDEWNVYSTDEPATKVAVTDNSFEMPAYKVTISASFKLAKVTETRLAAEFPGVGPKDTISTVCLSGAVAKEDIAGCTVYEIAYKEVEGGNPTKIYLDQVLAMEAGKPYIIILNSGATEATFKYIPGEMTTAQKVNGLQGTFDAITDGSVLEDNYILYSNTIAKCGTGCSLGARKAYIVMDDVTDTPTQPAPGRRRVVLGANTPTSLVTISAPAGEVRKVIVEGQFYIIRDGKAYNAAGQLVK